MNWQVPPYLILLILASGLTVYLITRVYQYRPKALWITNFIVLLLLVAIWSLGHAFEWASADLTPKVIFSNLQYIPSSLIPVLWLIFALQYTDRSHLTTSPYIILALIIPAATILLKWSNGYHHLIWREYSLVSIGPYTRLDITRYGLWYWVSMGYSYFFLILGTIVLLQAFFKTSGPKRGQMRAILIGAVAPLAVNFIYTIGISPFEGLNLTPFAFSFTGAQVAWGLFRYFPDDTNTVSRATIVNSINDGLLIINTNNHIVDMNSIAEEILGKSKDTLIGQPLTEAIPQWDMFIEKRDNKNPERSELHIENKNKRHYYDINISQIANRHGRAIGRSILMRDITTRKNVEEDMKQAHQEALTAAKMKTQLLANVSHDLRSPLGAILGYSEILQSEVYGKINRKQNNIITEVLASTEQLLNFVNNLLWQSQLETGALEFKPQTMETHKIFQGIHSSTRALAHAKGLEIITNIDSNMPETLFCDRHLLNQIIANLVSNGVKFTEQGYVRIWAQLENKEFWSINIKDSGIGIPKKKQARVYNLIKGISKPVETNLSETGIGFSIIREITELMGGQVDFQSVQNQGSKFTVSLPFKPKETSFQK